MTAQIRIGTQGWNYADWIGPFYPEGTRQPEMLGLYAQAFDTVEVDSTFYAVPPPDTVRGWSRRTPDGFVFALKLPREITHERQLRDAGDETALFLDHARLLEEKLGPILVQLGPDFGPSGMEALRAYLALLPRDLRFAVELRHPRWASPKVLPDLLSSLGEHNVAFALSDGHWFPRDALLDLAARPTADFHYVRWMGADRDLTDFSHVQVDRGLEMRTWVRALAEQAARGMDVYGYANNLFAGHAPASARELQRLLGERPLDPRELGEQITLF